jgi:hypothetical protein
MIPNHDQFLTAITERKQVCVRFYSQADSGVLDRVCAPMDYGFGNYADGLNRYWIWDYENPGSRRLGLLPQQILDLQVLGELFDPQEFNFGPSMIPIRPAAVPEVPGAGVAPTTPIY